MQTLDIPARPLLRPWYTVARGDAGQLIMHYADTAVVMHGNAVDTLVRELFPLLDGTRSVEQILHELGTTREDAIRHALQQLADSGLLLNGPALPISTPSAVASSLHYLAATMPAGDALTTELTKLQRIGVCIVGSAPAGAEIARSLQQAGVKMVTALSWQQTFDGPPRIEFLVVTPSPDELGSLPAWNARALECGTPWMQVLPFDGRFAAIGPVFIPGETCCYTCFTLRRAGNVGYGDEFAAIHNAPATYPTTPALELLVAGVAGLAVLRWLMRKDEALPGRFYAVETAGDIALTAHHVYRVPRCPACSTAIASPSPWFDAVE